MGSIQFILKELEDFDIDFNPEINSSNILKTLLKRVMKGPRNDIEHFSLDKGPCHHLWKLMTLRN